MSRRKQLRAWAGSAVVDGFFRGASRLGRQHPRSRPERHGVEVLRDLAYLDTGLPDHRLDVYRPVGATGPLPVVLYVHGGGFRILSKDSHWLPALAFARRGYVVFNISYRLAPRHPFPAALQDTAAAWLWVIENAARFGGDVGRIVLAGESAGGNLVTALAVASCWRRDEPWARAVFEAGVTPRVVLPAAALLQVSQPERFWRERPMPRFLRERIQEVSDAYLLDRAGHDLADPLVLLERGDAPDRPLPPFWAGCGTADPIVDDTRRLEAALAARGVTHEVRYYPGEHHAFHMFVFKAQARAFWSEMLQFADHHARAPREEPALAAVSGLRS